MHKIVVFIPVEHKEAVKEAMFVAGAGRQGLYDRCAFESEGTGQFRPLEGAHPTIGRVEEVSYVPEVRVEMLCGTDDLKKVVKAMKSAHPYEEPAYDIIQTLGSDEYI